MAGNWQNSSQDAEIVLMDGHTFLKAKCRNRRGNLEDSRLDLDDHIGDINSTALLCHYKASTKH
jgi:hypothetical protein